MGEVGASWELLLCRIHQILLEAADDDCWPDSFLLKERERAREHLDSLRNGWL